MDGHRLWQAPVGSIRGPACPGCRKGPGQEVTAPPLTGQKLLDSLAETWDFFFSDVLPTLQAIFYPVQVHWGTGWRWAMPGTGRLGRAGQGLRVTKSVKPTATLHPQGKEPSVRQLALLHFRNAITLSVKLEDALARAHARVPPAIVQMLLVLQVRAQGRAGVPQAGPV